MKVLLAIYGMSTVFHLLFQTYNEHGEVTRGQLQIKINSIHYKTHPGTILVTHWAQEYKMVSLCGIEAQMTNHYPLRQSLH